MGAVGHVVAAPNAIVDLQLIVAAKMQKPTVCDLNALAVGKITAAIGVAIHVGTVACGKRAGML